MTCVAETVQSSTPIRIVCIGDSITQGGKRDRKEYTYRWPLFQMLVDGGIPFNFIGSLKGGLHADAKWPTEYKGVPFDPDHEGVYGIKTIGALERLPEAMEKWTATPDIALIHLGTNDQSAKNYDQAVKDPLRQIIRLLRMQNPNIVILLGHLMFNDSPGAFRIMASVSELRKEMDTQESPVRIVQHYQGWNEQPQLINSDTFDWAHPNPTGQRKMAKKWMEAMQPWLKPPHNLEVE
jgi:lysophospholipase L1-like esterase